MIFPKNNNSCNASLIQQYRGCTFLSLLSLLLLLPNVITSVAVPVKIDYHETNANNGQQKERIHPDPYMVPSLTLSDLVSAHYGAANSQASEILVDALSTNGILAITDIDNNFAKTRNDALSGLCECTSSPHTNLFVSSIDNTDMAFLDDGLTTRTSLATATAKGGIPLPLPTSKIDSVCNHRRSSVRGDRTTTLSTGEAMETLRDYVSNVSQEFIQSLDKMIISKSRSMMAKNSVKSTKDGLLRSSTGNAYQSLHSIVVDSNHLEHFHVYSKRRNVENEEMVEESDDSSAIDIALTTHTDAGLFLSFVPAVSCHNSNDSLTRKNDDESFVIMVDGVLRRAVFPSSGNTVVIMLGAGAEHWMNMPNGLSLRATRHAVQMKGGDSRAWYGMMHLVPENAIIQDSPREVTFADMRQSMLLRDPKRIFGNSTDTDGHDDDIVVGCGFDKRDHQQPKVMSSAGILHRRRRLQMVPDASHCDNSRSFYCWMSCLDIPDHLNAANHLDNGEWLYCADQAKLGQGLDAAVRNCEDPETRLSGSAMNTNCAGTWHKKVAGVNAHEELDVQVMLPITVDNTPPRQSSSIFSNTADIEEEPYCYGGTSMFMNGFQWTSMTCVIYLFPSWILNTRGKMFVASIGTIIFGVAVEGVIQGRRILLGRLKHEGRTKKLAMSTLLYGVQLTMSYLIMLVIMTYSGPLFLCTIVGLMGGHFGFQWMMLADNNNNGTTEVMEEEGGTPCCQNVVNPSSAPTTSLKGSSEESSSDLLGRNDVYSDEAVEITPSCCQNLVEEETPKRVNAPIHHRK